MSTRPSCIGKSRYRQQLDRPIPRNAVRLGEGHGLARGSRHPFLGKEIHEQRRFSEETARIIDQEVQRFLTSAAERAEKLLVKHRDELKRIADALLEQESLDKQALTELLGERIKIGADGNGMG